MTEGISKGVLEGAPKILFYPVLMKHFGLAGALIIQQIHYWCVTNRENKDPERQGHHWMFMSIAQWVDRLEVVGRSKVVSTIAELEKAGVVVSASFNKYSYDRTKWYRIDYAKLASVLNGEAGEVDFLVLESERSGARVVLMNPVKSDLPDRGICHGVAYHLPPDGIPNATRRHDDTKKNLKKNRKEDLDVLSHVEHGQDLKPSSGRKIVIKKGKVQSTASEILKQFKANKEGPSPEKVSPANMELMWKKQVSQLEGVSFVKSFTAMQRGQCKHYINAVGQERAFPVLRHVLANWISFTKYVESNAGVKKTPALPDLGFLLKFAEYAVNFSAAYLGKVPKSVETVSKVPPVKAIIKKMPKPVQSIAPQEEVKPQDSEDEDELVDLDFLNNWKKGGL